MPIVTSQITGHGAVIDVLVGVHAAWRTALRQAGRAVPPEVPVRAVIDTGSALTGFSSRVFGSLSLPATARTTISTPSTPVGQPHVVDQFHVALTFVAGGTTYPFAEAWVIAADGFDPAAGIEGLIGRDVLDHCSFEYWGPSRVFHFAF